jgi:hypothetical protein
MPVQHSYRDIDAALSSSIPESGPLRDYMNWAVQTTAADPYFHLAAILPSFAHELTRKGFRLGSSLRPLRLMTAIIGESGRGKSTCLSNARRLTKEWMAITEPDRMQPHLHANGSIAGIIHAMQSHWHEEGQCTSPIFTLDELSALLTHDQFADAFNQLWDGTDFQRHYRHLQKASDATESTTVRSPVLLGAFAGTVSALQPVVEGYHIEGGIISRILWYRQEPPLNDADFSKYMHVCFDSHEEWRSQVAQSCAAWSAALKAYRIMGNPRMILVEDEVYEFIREKLWGQVRSAQGSRTGSVITRLVEHVQTVGAIYAATESTLAEGITVKVRHVAMALRFIEKCRDSILGIEKHLAVEQVMKDVAAVQDVISASGAEGATRSELYPKTKLPKNRIDQAISHLVDSEDIVQVMSKATGRGRRSIRYYVTAHAPTDEPEIPVFN